MAVNAKAIKISNKAYTVLRQELEERMNSKSDRLKFKDMASDLIILGSKKKEEKNSEEETVQNMITLKKWDKKFDEAIIEAVAHIVYWEHMKLALSKGFRIDQAKAHVHQFLTDSGNKLNIIGIMENYLNSIGIQK